jgi:hypothetical protein
MTTTYPSDATAPVTAFSVVAQTIYNNTGFTTDFDLPSSVDNKGEVVAYLDGILQETSSYELAVNNTVISFLIAPQATQLVIQTITLPARYRLTRSFPAVRAIEYSNSAITSVTANTYLINSYQESFALPSSVNVSSTSDFLVFLSGVYQGPDSFTYPSVSLGYKGIDIGDNTATKLLLNYSNSFIDGSPSPVTMTNVGPVTLSNTTGTYEAVFDGASYLTTPSNEIFNIHNQSVTLDTYFRPDTGIYTASNQTLFSRYEDSDNYYKLHLVGANSNVGFIINSGGAITELYGGNANGGSNYHVAVSYDINSAVIGLYVNNVRVSLGSYSSSATTNGPVDIGKFTGNDNANSEYYHGSVDFTRFATSTRYRAESLQPVTVGTPQTVISGAPLGSINSTDTLSIRVFDATVTVSDRFSSMSDRKPDKGITSKRSFDVITFTSQAGYEKRRLKSRRSKREYDLKYTNVTGIEKIAIENFYTARSGEYETFIFDLSHINESGTITVRFDKSLDINQVLSVGTNLADNFYDISFKLREVFD